MNARRHRALERCPKRDALVAVSLSGLAQLARRDDRSRHLPLHRKRTHPKEPIAKRVGRRLVEDGGDLHVRELHRRAQLERTERRAFARREELPQSWRVSGVQDGVERRAANRERALSVARLQRETERLERVGVAARSERGDRPRALASAVAADDRRDEVARFVVKSIPAGDRLDQTATHEMIDRAADLAADALAKRARRDRALDDGERREHALFCVRGVRVALLARERARLPRRAAGFARDRRGARRGHLRIDDARELREVRLSQRIESNDLTSELGSIGRHAARRDPHRAPRVPRDGDE